MVTYDKPKRKNSPSPQLAVWNMISSLVSGLFHYGLVVPIRWAWRFSGSALIWSWHTIWWIAKNTVLAPFIFMGRLLGFLANPIPDGLSPKEAEVYQRINRQFRRQKRWYLHLITFLMGMATLWIPEFLSSPSYPRTGMMITVTVMWLVALGGHRLWMNLGDSEDHAIGEALHQIRKSQSAVYYEEEVYNEQPFDASRLVESEFDDAEWIDDEELHQSFKAKRQGD